MAYMLRIRFSDNDKWGEPTAYASKRERDTDERTNRILCGIRTHSWTETKKEERERLASEESAEAEPSARPAAT